MGNLRWIEWHTWWILQENGRGGRGQVGRSIGDQNHLRLSLPVLTSLHIQRLWASMTKKMPRPKVRASVQPLTTATTRFPRDTNSAPVGYRYLGVFIPSITSMGKGCDDTATHGQHWGQANGGRVYLPGGASVGVTSSVTLSPRGEDTKREALG